MYNAEIRCVNTTMYHSNSDPLTIQKQKEPEDSNEKPSKPKSSGKGNVAGVRLVNYECIKQCSC